MNIAESFQMAIKNIVSSKMRTFLTMLGIIIGIAAVMVIVGLGNGMEGYITDSFSSMGTNTLTVSIMGRGSTRSVSEDDMYDLVQNNSNYFEYLSPTVTMSDTAKVGTESLSSTVTTGISEDYFNIKQYGISQGRGIQYIDIEKRLNVCVIGNYLSQTYYNGNPIGQSIKVGANKFTIVGVMSQKSDEMEEGGTDDVIFIPYSTASRLSYSGTIGSYLFSLKSEDYASEGKTIIEDRLTEIFGSDSAFDVMSMSEMLDTMTSMVNVVILVLVAIAGISLVVGGIGIMNIMLVSVTERTKEIGIRKALGAKEKSIMSQFVIEAATTSALGGIIGILVGYGLSKIASVVVASIMEAELSVSPDFASVLIAFGISAGIGILFGFLPAKTAAKLNPIDALRYE